jgi:hypothetical protein
MPGNASGHKPGENCGFCGGRGEGNALASMRAPMSIKVISRRIDASKVSIKMVDGSLVQGKVNVYHDEEVIQRVSDIFTKISDPFIVVFDATAEGKSGRVLILNKRNIAWVSPEDDPVRQERREDEKPAEPRGSFMDRLRST